MFIISASEITKSFIVENVLEGLNFTVSNNDKIGLVGLNGSGKTTLFNIICGNLDYDSGSLHIQKDLKIGYLEQHINIDSEKTLYDECLTVFEHLIEQEKLIRKLEHDISEEGKKGHSQYLDELLSLYSNEMENFSENNGYSYISEIKGTLKGLGFTDDEFDKQVSVLSGGQKTRVMLAKLLLQKPDLLLLDEPTNHLDIGATEWLEKYLNDYKGTVILISHDRYFLDKIVNKIFLIEHKNLYIYNGNYTEFMEKRKRDLEIQAQHYENQQDEIKRQKEIINRFIKYGGERYIRLARSRQKMLDKMDLIEKPESTKKSSFKFTPRITSGKNVLQVEELSKSFPDKELFTDINFQIYKGDKVGLIGPNGVGKTTLFNILLGKVNKTNGHIYTGAKVKIAYYEQEMKTLNPNNTILDEIMDDYPKLTLSEIRGFLGRFMFYGDEVFKEISELSGGERARISLLKLMLSDANTLFMDEPTNHLDIDSKEVLEKALIDYEGTLFIISHDRYFLNSVVDKIFELNENGINEYLGNYNYYLEKKEQLEYEDFEEEEKKTKTQIVQEKKKEREKKNEAKKLAKEILNIEEEINLCETRINDIDLDLCREEIYQDIEKVKKLTNERNELTLKIEDLYEKWMELKE